MLDDKNFVPRETPPFDNLGPILRVDVKKLLQDIESMDEERKEQAMELLKQYVVILENIRV
jgi:hypothetical protein